MAGLESNETIQLVLRDQRISSRVIRRVRQEIYVDALRDQDMALTPLPGQTVPILWNRDETLYQQLAFVVDVLDPIPIIVMRLEGEPDVVEQRKALRIKMAVPLEYGLIRPGSEMFVTTTIDLSATGLRFPCALQFWVGLELRLIIRLEGQPIEVPARVVRVAARPREIRGRKSWETAVQFLRISLKDRRIVEQFVRKQHQRLQTGSS